MLGSILESNRLQLEHGFNLVTKTGKKRIGILGLSFKAGTDDLRESPNVQLIELLIGKGYEISVFDCEVSLSALRGANRSYIEKAIPHISKLLVTTVSELFDNSEALVIAKRTPNCPSGF